jgi:hypothetical protein
MAGAGQVQVARNRADALFAGQMTAADLGNQTGEQQPQILRRERRMIARAG